MNKNLYDAPLKPCPIHKMAITGYERTGKCNAHHNDKGSHHICVDVHPMQAQLNFCHLTGQPDWCSKKGPCYNDKHEQCPRRGWCVCQWAFADAVQNGGDAFCDNVKIDCEASNLHALNAYRDKATGTNGDKYEKALRCLKKRCPAIGVLR